jgi:hypothetical protein
MKKINYQSIIFVYCLFIFVFGCEQVPPPQPSEEKQQEIAAMMIKNYVDEIKRELELKPIEIDVAAEISEIDRMPKAEQNLRFSILAGQLIEVKQINDAVNVLDKINDPMLRDTYFAKITRYHIDNFNNSAADKKSPISTPTSTSTPISTPTVIDETDELRTIVSVIDKINDLSILTELSIELAAVAVEKLDKSVAFDMLVKTADKVQSSKAAGSHRVKSLQSMAHWFLKHEQKERAMELCRKAEEIIPLIEYPLDNVFVRLDLSSLYMLLDSISDAGRVCDASIAYIEKITTPAEKATAILKIAETFSILQINFSGRRNVAKLVYLKKLILAVDPILAAQELETGEEIAAAKGAKQSELQILSWERIREMRDVLLRGLVRHQVWLVPESRISLDEIWSTIHDIENDSLRDDAIIAVVDMLCITGSLEEAKDWADFINSTDKKNNTLKKINTKSESLKKQIQINDK